MRTLVLYQLLYIVLLLLSADKYNYYYVYILEYVFFYKQCHPLQNSHPRLINAASDGCANIGITEAALTVRASYT